MKKHTLWMIVGCGLPLLFIFFAPVLGLGSGTSLFIFILAMFACHLFMPMHGHGDHKQHRQNNQADSKTLKTENHEQH